MTSRVGAGRVMGVLFAAIWVVASCVGPGDEGTETNFLCSTHADCDKVGSRFACIGGVCRVGSRGPRVPDAGSREAAGTCHPSACPTAEFGSPCCVGRDGPCGIDSGFGCEPWTGNPDGAPTDAAREAGRESGP